jgi:hypothetical protein
MKRSKIALTLVIIGSIIGSTLAFKAGKINNRFYYYTTTLVNGNVTGACLIVTSIPYCPNPTGIIILTLSSTTVVSVPTCTVRVVQC